jgi:hypothetical protein
MRMHSWKLPSEAMAFDEKNLAVSDSHLSQYHLVRLSPIAYTWLLTTSSAGGIHSLVIWYASRTSPNTSRSQMMKRHWAPISHHYIMSDKPFCGRPRKPRPLILILHLDSVE